MAIHYNTHLLPSVALLCDCPPHYTHPRTLIYQSLELVHTAPKIFNISITKAWFPHCTHPKTFNISITRAPKNFSISIPKTCPPSPYPATSTYQSLDLFSTKHCDLPIQLTIRQLTTVSPCAKIVLVVRATFIERGSTARNLAARAREVVSGISEASRLSEARGNPV